MLLSAVQATTSVDVVQLTWEQSSHHTWKNRRRGGYFISYSEAGSGDDFKVVGVVRQHEIANASSTDLRAPRETLAFEHVTGKTGTYEYRITGYITTDRWGSWLPRTLISNPGPVTSIEVTSVPKIEGSVPKQ